jgi:hypothetical protein
MPPRTLMIGSPDSDVPFRCHFVLVRRSGRRMVAASVRQKLPCKHVLPWPKRQRHGQQEYSVRTVRGLCAAI